MPAAVRIWLMAAALLVSLAGVAFPQAGGTRILLSDSVRTAQAGETVSFVFTIESPARSGGSAILALPPGWRPLTDSGELPEGSSRVSYMVAAAIPAGAAPGRYPVTLDVRAAGQSSSSTAWVIVPARTSISLSKVDAPQTIVAGSKIQGTFLLTNRGNAPVRVRVALRSPLLSVRDSVFVDIAPGASREIPVEWKTDPRIRALIESVTYANADVIGHKGATARSSFRVVIAPEEAHAPAPVHAVASRARIIGASSERGGSGAEISGSGLLRDGFGARISYVARRMQGPQSLFGDRSEYRLAVSSSHLSAVVGHHVYRLSRLSESGRFAAGAQAEARSNGWTIGGFLNRDHSRPDRPEQRAMFLNRDFGNGNLLRVNFLDRKEARGGTVVTAQTTIRSLPFGTVEAEAGQAINAAQAEAWALRVHGRFERFGYNVARHRSDNDYPGSTRGSAATNASFDARPHAGLRLRGTFNDHRLARASGGLPTGESHHWAYFGGLTLLEQVAVEYRRNGRDDGSFRLQPKREEQLLSARINGRVGTASVVASAAFGSASAEGETPRNLARYAASASVRKSRNLTISMNVEAHRGGTLFLPRQKSEVRGGMTGSYTSSEGSRFSVSGYASEHRMPEVVRDATFEASWERQLPSGHSFALRARLHRNPGFQSADASVLRAEYTVPFGLPVGPSRSRGRVSGRVTDAATGVAIAGAMIQLGRQVAVTDGKGRFAFALDSETPVALGFLGSAATAGTIPVRDLPASVTPRMGRTSTYDIALTKAGRVEGKIRRFINEPGSRAGDSPRIVEDPLGVPRARVELSNGSQILRTTSNGSGEFTFTDLRPGAWTLRVAEGDLPEHSRLEVDSVDVVVAPGETAKAAIEVVPRKRKITIVDIR